MNNKLLNELTRVIDTYRNVPNVEIELRLGFWNERGFRTCVGKKCFDNIQSVLEQSKAMKRWPIEVSDVHTHKLLRRVTVTSPKQSTVVHKKKKLEFVDFSAPGTPFDIRLSVCQEIPVSTKNNEWCFLRNRQRTTFSYKMWKYDITECTLSKPIDEYTDHVKSYEVELELDLKKAGKCSSAYLAESGVLKIVDLLQMSDTEKIHLKSIDLIKTSNNKHHNKPSNNNGTEQHRNDAHKV